MDKRQKRFIVFMVIFLLAVIIAVVYFIVADPDVDSRDINVTTVNTVPTS